MTKNLQKTGARNTLKKISREIGRYFSQISQRVEKLDPKIAKNALLYFCTPPKTRTYLEIFASVSAATFLPVFSTNDRLHRIEH